MKLNTKMIPFARFYLIFENFETVSKLFLDPQHKDKEWYQLQKDFEKSGGKEIGAGGYGKVYTHPKWPYVVKMFTRDDPYLKFARYAYKHPHKSFPKFYGAPQKIIPEFSRNRSMGEVYLSRIEKLHPLTLRTYDEIDKYKNYYTHYRYMVDMEKNARHFFGNTYNYRLNELKHHLADMPENIESALDAMTIVNKEAYARNWGTSDWHINNLMQRDNGDIVLIDPVWEGENPQAVADEQRRIDLDFGDAENIVDQIMSGKTGDIKPRLVRGGELPKKFKKKIKRPKPIVSSENESSWPF